MPKKGLLNAAQLDDLIATLAPRELADEWDNVGLLVGDPAQTVRRILVALEVTTPLLREASQRKADTLVVHHPLIFRPLKRLLDSDPVQSLVRQLCERNIALIAAHTNLDRAPGGTNHALAAHVGIANVEWLLPKTLDADLKFAVFVPVGHESAIIGAIARGGGGVIGNYTHCTFRSPGAGTYLPGEGTRPFAGEPGRFEQAEELRIECHVPRNRLSSLLAEVRKAHPYEEIAFDVYPIHETPPRWGLGLIGALPAPETLAALARRLKKSLRIPHVQTIGDPERPVQRVALCTGSGASILRQIPTSQADVFITGELDHHAALEARERGIAALCLGHFESEVIVAPHLAQWLRAQEPIQRARIDVIHSTAETSPFTTR